MENNLILPDLKDRIQAVIIDIIIMFILAFLVTKLFDNMIVVTDQLRYLTFIIVFLLYDPLLTSLIGGTLGHRALNLRVKRNKDPRRNISFPVAVFRFYFKLMLGLISLITVSVNSKGRAIHDLLSGSIVIVKGKNNT